jgi:ABC-type transporter Mla subunit MlaD
MKKKDKIVGIATITVALLVIAFVAFAMWRNEKRAINTVYAKFPEMGALQNQDIVTIRGFTIGHITSITRVSGAALVEIDLDEPRVFRKDTRFRNISPNIMGSRSIAIEPGIKEEYAPKDYVFEGEFEPGFAEILYLSDVAKQQVAAIMDFIRILQTGSEENSSLQKKLEKVLNECEDLLAALANVLNSVEKQTMRALNEIDHYAGEISKATVKVNKSLDTIMTQAQDGVQEIESIISTANTYIESLNEILIQFENNPVTVALMDKKDIINDITNLQVALQAFVGNIDKNGVKIYDEDGKRKGMVSLKNIHLLRETARSKAKKRAEQQ